MRKSILMMAISAIFTGNFVYGQDCNDTENAPAVGMPYTYSVAVSGGTAPNNYNGDGVYQWYVTQNTNLLDNTAIINETNDFFSVGAANSPYNATTGTSNSLQLTWTADALSDGNPFYLVLKYAEDNTNCEAMNMKAMRIQPLNTFKLNIEPVADANGTAFTAGNEKVCAADVTSATIVGDKVKYVYGKNTLYYKVTATGFSGDWKPSITLPALSGTTGTDAEYEGRQYETVEWSTDGGTTFANFDNNTFAASGNAQNLTATNNATISDAAAGASFILKVVIDNGTYEGLTNETINMSTQGNMVLANGNTSTVRDVADDCSDLTADRNTEQIILARPTLNATSGGFIIQIQ